jgi:hypothetical protein
VRQHLRGPCGEGGQAPLDDLFLPCPLGHAGRIVAGPAGQVADRRANAQELDAVLAVAADGVEQAVGVEAEDAVVGAGRDWEDVLEVARVERAVGVLQDDLLAFEHGAVGVTQHRQQHLVLEFRFQRVPVDVEDRRVRRALAVLQHVLPPGVCRPGDAHVVRHQVDDVAHAVRAQRADPGGIGLVVADLGVQAGGIRDVIAVRAPRHRQQVAGRVRVRDPERVEIGNDRRGVREGEARVELQPVCRDRQYSRCHSFILAATDAQLPSHRLEGKPGRRAASRAGCPARSMTPAWNVPC